MLCAALVVLPPSRAAQPQIADEVRVFAYDTTGGGYAVARFDRALSLLGVTHVSYLGGIVTDVTPIGLDAEGRSWIAFDPLNTTQLLRLDSEGTVLPSAWLQDNPVHVVVDANGRAYALTRIGLSAPGPAYGVTSDGTVFWSNISGPTLFNVGFPSYPQTLALTAGGELWIGHGTKLQPSEPAVPFLVRVNKASGAVIGTLALPGNPNLDINVSELSAAPDGSMWAFVDEASTKKLYKTDGVSILQTFPIVGGFSPMADHMYIDAQDRPHVISLNNETGGSSSRILRYDPAAPAAPDAAYQFGGQIVGWAFGPSGEDLFAIIGPMAAPLTRRLERMSLVTSTKSAIPLDPMWFDGKIAYGDATGWVHASVIDRSGDNDGDGASNGIETDAGSNPYDALSTPDGPQVYLSFQPVTNAITLRWDDSSGLFDPVGGLDLTSIELEASGYGEVMAYLWPFLTDVTIAPDGTSATVVLGNLPLPANLQIGLQARVKDKTGHEGWDWQVTPPGDL